MGTIVEKLTYLNTTKTMLRDSLNKFGSSILSTDTFRSYDTKLNEIYDKLPKVTQSGAGFTLSDVQNGQVDDFKMSGVDLEQDSTNGNQLLNFNLTPAKTASTTSTFIDDTLTVSSSSGTYKRVEWDILSIIKNNPSRVIKFGKQSYSSTSNVGNVQLRIKINNTNTYVQILNNNYTIPSDTTTITEAVFQVYSNNSETSLEATTTIVKPLLYFDNNNTYEPYTGGIASPNPDYPQDIKVVEGRQVITDSGKNLFDINSGININNLIDAGITSVFNEDGTITVNGEKTANYKYIRYSVTLPAGTYYFCGCPSGGSNSSYSSLVQLTQDTSSQIFDTGNGATFTLTEQTAIQYFPVRVGNASLTFNNTIFKPMISTTPITYDDFEPYYNPAGYNIDLHGKNLFDKDNVQVLNGYIKNDNGIDTQMENWSYLRSYVSVLPNTTYTLSGDLVKIGNNVRIYHYDNDKNWISRSEGAGSGINIVTFTTPNNCYYVQFQMNTNYYNINSIQIEEGSTATNYEEYYDYKLAKMPNTTYKNKIYKNNGNWYFEENVKKAVLDGSNSENWGTFKNSMILMDLWNNKPTIMCDYFKPTTNSGWVSDDDSYRGMCSSLNTAGQFRCMPLTNMTLEEFKTWLSTHNVIVWYELQNPVTTQITNTTLINQLEAISVYTGTNIITISNDNNIIPEIEITRLKELEKLA